MIYFVDSNIFLRTLIKENETTHASCIAFLKKIKTNKIEAVTSDIILAEVAWTLGSFYTFSKKEVIAGIQSIVHLHGLSYVNSMHTQTALTFYESHAIKYIDALVASIKEIHTKKWTVVSYDRDFDRIGIVRKEPQDIV